MDMPAIEAALSECLLTDEEFADGNKDKWCCLKDPFAERNIDWPSNDEKCES